MASFYDLFKLTDPEEERAALDYARQLTPAQRSVMDERQFERQGVKGIERMGRGLLGLPESPEGHREMAAQELRALAAKVRPGTAEFYDAAIPILQKHGMPAEVAQLEQQRLALETGKGELDPLLKMKRARDLLLKSPDASSPTGQAALAAIDRKIKGYGVSTQGGADPEFLKLLAAYEAAIEAGQGDRAALIKQRIDAEIKQKQGRGEDMTEYQRIMVGLREEELKRKQNQDDRKATREDEGTVSALQSTVRAVDNEIQAAQRLLAHPGLPKITGSLEGALPLTAVAAKGNEAAGAAALFATIEGQTFIRALQDLKATSRTGASGLGQLTEREGDKIQNAKTSLSRQQPVDQFKRTLTAYIELLTSTRAIAAKELVGGKADVPVAPTPIVDVAPKTDPRPARPTPAPAAKPKFKATRVN